LIFFIFADDFLRFIFSIYFRFIFHIAIRHYFLIFIISFSFRPRRLLPPIIAACLLCRRQFFIIFVSHAITLPRWRARDARRAADCLSPLVMMRHFAPRFRLASSLSFAELTLPPYCHYYAIFHCHFFQLAGFSIRFSPRHFAFDLFSISLSAGC